MAEEGYLDHWGRVAQNHPADPHYACGIVVNHYAP